MALYRATAEGPVPMTPEEETEFLAEQATNAARKNADEMKAYMLTVKDLREKILNRLAGILAAASYSGDEATAAACVTARQALLDITIDPGVLAATNAVELKAAVKAAYVAIVMDAPTNLHNAFDKVDS